MIEEQSLYNAAIEKWGITAQLDMLVEECAELIQAVNKLKRTSAILPIMEEIIDVDIMLGQVKIIIESATGINIAWPEHKEAKLKRLAERLKEG